MAPTGGFDPGTSHMSVHGLIHSPMSDPHMLIPRTKQYFSRDIKWNYFPFYEWHLAHFNHYDWWVFKYIQLAQTMGFCKSERTHWHSDNLTKDQTMKRHSCPKVGTGKAFDRRPWWRSMRKRRRWMRKIKRNQYWTCCLELKNGPMMLEQWEQLGRTKGPIWSRGEREINQHHPGASHHPAPRPGCLGMGAVSRDILRGGWDALCSRSVN